MTIKWAIASGKGGTGKTTVSINLYHYLAKNYSKNIQLVDCDVEEPNDALFFDTSKIKKSIVINQKVPVIDANKCTFCGKCAEWCEYNAISIIPKVKYAAVNADLCHSCGACSIACGFNAITEHDKLVGTVADYDVPFGLGLSEGRLSIGSAMQTFLIKELKKNSIAQSDLILYDAPPGTSCPVVETVSDVDFVILVTEPTPFGLHDLKLMVALLNEIQKPFGIVINKSGLGNNELYEFIESEQLNLLGKIPFSKAYAHNYAAGKLIENGAGEMEKYYKQIVDKLQKQFVL
jgi:MinD superfamily P-loop ATPase